MRTALQGDSAVSTLTYPVVWEHQPFVGKEKMRNADSMCHVVTDGHFWEPMSDWLDLPPGPASDVNSAILLNHTVNLRPMLKVARVA